MGHILRIEAKGLAEGLDVSNERVRPEKNAQVLTDIRKLLYQTLCSRFSLSICSSTKELSFAHTQNFSVIKVSKTYSEKELWELKLDQSNKKT